MYIIKLQLSVFKQEEPVFKIKVPLLIIQYRYLQF